MSLDALFRPRSIAVLGASTRTGHANAIITNLRKLGFDGEIHPVNPKYDEFAGLPCYPSIAEVPGPVDLAAIVTSMGPAVGLLESAAAAGARAATLYATGMDPKSEEGRRTTAAVRDIAAAHGMSVLGPNCMGHMVPAFAAGAYTGVVPDLDRAVGGTAVITQSGSVGTALLASTDRIGVGALVSSGNEVVTSAAELLAYLVEDDSISNVALFLEQIRDPERFAAAARRARELGKPVVALMVGRSRAAQETVAAHSGALAGNARVVRAYLEGLGIAQVETFGEMIETLVAFGHPLRPPTRGIGCVVGSGGELSMVLDLVEPLELEFPPLDDASRAAVSELGDWTSVMTNPADVWGPIPYETCYRTTLAALAKQPDIGALVVISDGARPDWHPSPGIAVDLARFAVEVQSQHGKPAFVLCNLNAHLHPDVREVLDAAGVPGLEGTEYALKALQHWMRFHHPHDDPGPEAAIPLADDLVQGDGEGALDEVRSKALFNALGIPSPREVLVDAEAADLRAAAAEIGYPVVVKAVSSTIAHKSDLGLVHLGVRDDADLAAAHRAIATALDGVSFGGFLVAEQVDGHRELILGLHRDPQFGLTLVLGAGGTMAEVLDDAVVAIPPVTAPQARRMVDRLRIRPLLDAWRGMPPADVDALCDAIVGMGQLAGVLGDRLVSAEINPLAVLPAGQGVRALDGLVVMAERAGLAPRSQSCIP